MPFNNNSSSERPVPKQGNHLNSNVWNKDDDRAAEEARIKAELAERNRSFDKELKVLKAKRQKIGNQLTELQKKIRPGHPDWETRVRPLEVEAAALDTEMDELRARITDRSGPAGTVGQNQLYDIRDHRGDDYDQ